MKVGILFSGGKDSTYALLKAFHKAKPTCLISIISRNPESWMFHTPNITLTKLQAKSIGLPLIQKITKGEKEKELEQLKNAIKKAKKIYKIEGIVTGAIASVYQAKRIQEICCNLNLWCFNPLWLKDETRLLEVLLKLNFKIAISGIFAYPLSTNLLGRLIDKKILDLLIRWNREYGINLAGEGGEIETTVLDCPLFKKKIVIEKSEVKIENENCGFWIIKKARLVEK